MPQLDPCFFRNRPLAGAPRFFASRRAPFVLSLALLAGVLTLAGCEPADSGDAASSTAPRVTKFFFSPVQMWVGETATIECRIGFEDSDGDITQAILRIQNPDGTSTPDTPVSVTSGGQTAGEITFSFEATPDAIGTYVLQVELVDAKGQRSNAMDGDLKVSQFGDISVCGARNITCDSSQFCYNVEPDSCEYLDEHGLSLDACAEVEEHHQPVCVSSLENPDSPYAAESQCTFIQWWSNPTSLDADCRCGTSAVDVTPCRRPQDLPSNVHFGDGPAMRDVSGGGFADLGNGPVIGREWFLPTDWNNGVKMDQSMIWAVNLDTRDRRHVSGTYVDTQLGTTEVGSGDPLKEVYHLAKDAQDNLYALGANETLGEPMIWKIDTQTGARTLVYDASTMPMEKRCPNGNLNPGGRTDLQLNAGSLAIDPDGNFYLASTPASLPGPALVKLEKDTFACTIVTAVIKGGGVNSFKESIGPGYDNIQFPFRGVLWHDGKLIAISDVSLVEVDPADGTRRLISRAKDNGGRGIGPVADQGLGNHWTMWDPHHEMYWTVGGNIVVAVDPASGDRYSFPCWHPGLGLQGGGCNTTGRFVPGALERGGMVFDPEDPRHIYFAHDNIAVVKYDNQTSNAMIHSL